MNDTPTSKKVAAGENTQPLETSLQPAVESGPPDTTVKAAPADSTAEAAPPSAAAKPARNKNSAIIAKHVTKAQRDYETHATEMAKQGVRDFYLRVCITFSYIWLKIGNKDSYVDEVFAKLKAQYQDAWVPSKTTVQHYEAPILRWLLALARIMYPNDPNLPEKFTPTFLHDHPKYILKVGTKELKELSEECKTMVKLDSKYANGRVKPAKQQPGKHDVPEATIAEPADQQHEKNLVLAARISEPVLTSPKVNGLETEPRKEKVNGKTHKAAQPLKTEKLNGRGVSVASAEFPTPTNDELLEKI